ncbi:MAG: S8 family serine peptidase [Thermoleophilia bacterium]
MSRRTRRRLTAALAAVAALAVPTAASAADDAPSLLAKVGPSADLADIAADNDVALVRSFPEIGWAEFEVTDGEARDAANRLLADGRVFRLDYQRPGDVLASDLTPRDPFTANPLGLGQQNLTTDYHWRVANFFPAWDASRGSSAVRIAVVDSEFDTEHPDLKNKFTTGYNAERQTPEYKTSNVRASQQQINEAIVNPDNNSLHGTHVAGLAAASTDNGIGVSGAGFDSILVPVKVSLNFQVGDTIDAKFVGDAVEGIRWAADNGATVINMSFGTPRFHQALLDATNYAASKGVILVAAAGNTQSDPSQRGTIQYPAAFPNVIAVAATDQNNAVTNFSTNGDFVDVSAPGFQIFSTWDQRAPGVNINGQGAPYRILNGTSMASPIVAGLAALMKSVRPDLNAAEVEGLITQTAVDLGAGGRDAQFGAGLINADAAVRAAIAYTRPAPPPAPVLPTARFFWSCKVGAKNVAAGRRAFVRAPRGARVVCKGRTAPALRNARVEVQRFAARGGWKRIGVVRTNNKGRFGFTRRLSTVGNWRLRLAYAGSATVAPSPSVGVKLRAVRRR